MADHPGDDDPLRYDDMIGTVLGQPLATAGARAAAWVQIVDLVAQGRDGADADRAYAFLRDTRDAVPVEVREHAARALAGRRLPVPLVAAFADDRPSVAGAVLSTVRLPAEAWIDLLPALTPTMRGFVRNRRDLDLATRRALDSFGATDLVLASPAEAVGAELSVAIEPIPTSTPTLPASAESAPVARSVGVSISDLVRRIDAYRRDRPWPMAGAALPDSITAFRFETDADGTIIWVEGAPRGAIVGETLARSAMAMEHGVDGHAAGAFRRRAPFRDARLSVAGIGAAGGDWRISAVPFFAAGTGRFLGYRGAARRPRADEVAQAPRSDAGLLGGGIAPDSLRQLVHELRTPLNAIVGFAEMIGGQMLGPVGSVYRGQADAISGEGRRLMAAIDDLDMAARLDSERLALAVDRIDGAALIREIVLRYGSTSEGARFVPEIAADLPHLRGDPVVLERMIARLMAAMIGLAGPVESLPLTLDRDAGGSIALGVARPTRLAGRDERVLLDPGYAPDGDWPDAPLLGLGFSLRLVRNLAAAGGGTLIVEERRLVLRLLAGDAGAEVGKG